MKLLFVCHGNICRSPMAEYYMKHLVAERGLSDRYEIASAATSTEELGNGVYPPARRKLAEHGISCAGHAARQLTRADCERYDLLLGMDGANLQNMARIYGGQLGKMHLLFDFCEGRRSHEVADPWYSGDFETAWQDITRGCQALLDYLEVPEQVDLYDEILEAYHGRHKD